MPPPNNPSSRLGRELVRGYFSDDVNPGRTWQTQRAEQQNQQNAASQSQNQYQQPLNVTAQSQPDAQQQPPPTRLQETIAHIQHRCLSHPDTPQEFNLLSLLSGLECVPFEFKPTPPFYSTSPFNPTPPSPSSDSPSQKPGGQEPQSQVQGQGGGRAEAVLMALSDVWGINEERLQKAKLSVVAAMVAESSQLVRPFIPILFSPSPRILHPR